MPVRPAPPTVTGPVGRSSTVNPTQDDLSLFGRLLRWIQSQKVTIGSLTVGSFTDRGDATFTGLTRLNKETVQLSTIENAFISNLVLSGGNRVTTLGYTPSTTSDGPHAPPFDISGMSVTVTVPFGHRIRVSAEALISSSVSTDQVTLQINEGGTTLQSCNTGSDVGHTQNAAAILTPSAGSHTYKLTAARASGTGNLTNNAGATFPTFILVEDIT